MAKKKQRTKLKTRKTGAFFKWLNTQDETGLAVKLGVSSQAVNHWKHGRAVPKYSTLAGLVKETKGKIQAHVILRDFGFDF